MRVLLSSLVLVLIALSSMSTYAQGANNSSSGMGYEAIKSGEVNILRWICTVAGAGRKSRCFWRN